MILTNSIKIVATRCQILKLKCSKFDFGWDSTRPIAELRGLLLRAEKGREGLGREVRERKGTGGRRGIVQSSPLGFKVLKLPLMIT